MRGSSLPQVPAELQNGPNFTIARGRARRETEGMQNNPDNKVSLGCGTLILIALIVAIFSNGGTKSQLERLEARLGAIEGQLQRIENKLATFPAPAVEAPVAE